MYTGHSAHNLKHCDTNVSRCGRRITTGAQVFTANKIRKLHSLDGRLDSTNEGTCRAKREKKRVGIHFLAFLTVSDT